MRSSGCCARLPWTALLAVGPGVLVLALLLPCDPSRGAEDKKVAPGKATPGASDSSMYGGTPSRNLVNLIDKNIPTDWSVQAPQRNIKWTANLGSKAYVGPAIAGGKVFIGTNNKQMKNVLMCFRESDGKFLWQAVHDELPADVRKQAAVEGVVSVPAVEGNRLYYLSSRCEVICASTEGKAGTTEADIIWRLDLMNAPTPELVVYPHQHPASSPLIAGDLVIVGTSNGVDEEKVHSPKAPSLVAVDKKTGKVKWQDNSPGENIMHGQWSSPAYAVVNGKGQAIFGGGDGWLRGFEAQTGKPLWKFDCNPKAAKAGAGSKGARNYIVSTPVVFDNKVYVGVGQDPEFGSGVGHLWCVDITKTGDLSPVDDNFDPKAEVNKKSGLVWHFGGAADAKTAEQTGRDFLFGRTISGCAIHDGLLYVAELTGYLYCLDAKTGAKIWDHDLKAEIWGSPYYVDGKVYIGTGDGDVHIFAHGHVKKVIGKIEMEEIIYSTPVVANGVLYVTTMKHLYAIAAK